MIKFSDILKGNQFKNFFCILNKNTEGFKDFFPNNIVISNDVNEKLLWESIENIKFMNLKIFFSNFEIFYKKEYNNKILNIYNEYDGNLSIISPLGVFNCINFINDLTNHDIFKKYAVTKVISGNFLKFHKLHCSLKNYNSILLTIFFHYSYNFGDFLKFFIKNININIEIFNNHLILESFQEGFNIFLNNKNFPIEFLNSKLYKDLMDFNLIKTNIYDTYIYWKNYFSEESINYCQCAYTTYKDLENFTYYNLEEPEFIDFESTVENKRHISIELKEPQIVNDQKKFYLENILNLHNNFFIKKAKNIRVKSLRVTKKTSLFKFSY